MNIGYSLKEAQQRALSVYFEANKGYSVFVIMAFLFQRTATILKSVSGVLAMEEGKLGIARTQIIQIFTWVSSLANKVNVDLEKNFREHFPGLCPACGESICDCKTARLPERLPRKQLLLIESRLPETNLQLMLENIFTENELDESVDHLVAEVGELGQEIARAEILGSVSRLSSNQAFLLELADVTAHACAVASLLELDLAEGVLEYLHKGCPECKKLPCKCPLHKIELGKVGSRRVKGDDCGDGSGKEDDS